MSLVLRRLVALTLMVGPVMAQQSSSDVQASTIHLEVPAGTPLRLYITHRTWYRQDEIVEARFAEPVWAFDREVIPAGTLVQGQITRLNPVTAGVRARAITGGDFTPLKQAVAGFNSMTLANGRRMEIYTIPSAGLSTIYVPPRPPKSTKRHRQLIKSSKLNSARQFLERQAETKLSARSYGLFDFIRGPSKRESLINLGMSKLPYHPQWYRSGTRFDALLDRPLDFGTMNLDAKELESFGASPAPDSVAQMRLLSTLSSDEASVGDRMQGVLAKPLFGSDHKLVLPEGTLVNGKITLVQSARFFHRGGKLRFAVDSIDLPSINNTAENQGEATRAGASRPAQAQLAAVEADPQAVKVDQEGSAKASESKTRLLRPAIDGIIAAKTMDEDAGRQTASGSGGATGSNSGGLALGGFSGIGLIGIAVAQGPPPIGQALSFYRLAWSVYSNVISRGREVVFEKNANMMIRFGSSPRR